MNIKKKSILEVSEPIADSLSAISSPQRIAILLTIGNGEVCVCHLEAVLGWRQAYISQHLMALRQADILESNRKGKFIYYTLKNKSLLTVILNVANLIELPSETISSVINQQSYPSCDCPQCVDAITQMSSTEHSGKF
ncbi:MAG: helix-turn-helix transcriptional regulator [Anaerolineaceae bacterium]|nr:helix-turn-helix transcriptional regulator [Anaerolineaceae bacterium]